MSPITLIAVLGVTEVSSFRPAHNTSLSRDTPANAGPRPYNRTCPHSKGSVRGVPIIENIGYNLEDDPGASCSFDFGLHNHSTVGRNPGSP